MKKQNFFEDPKGILQEIQQQQSLRLQLLDESQEVEQQPPPHEYYNSQHLSTFTVPSIVQQPSSYTPITTSPITVPSTTSIDYDHRTQSHSMPVNTRRPKPGILRLDMSKPRRSSGGSVEFRMQPQLFGANISTPVGTTPPPHHLSVTWAKPPCDSIEKEFKIKSTTPSTPGTGATDATSEPGGVELNEITGSRRRSPEEKPYEYSLSYAASNLASPITEPFIDFPQQRHYEDYHIQSPGYSIHTETNNDNADDDDDDDDEDYSVSVSAIMQRRASVRGYRRKSSSRNSRRASSPMDHVLDNAERRRSSVYTTSSEEGTNPESTQEQIFENIRLHKEVIQSVKLQPWPIRKKLKLVRQAKTYVARHEGALQERFAMSRSTRDLWARFKILMAARWRHWKREIYSFLTVLIPWELRIKEIESHFGSGVASYFTFLRWLMWLNLMIALPLVLFVIGPEYFATKHDVMDPRKKMTYRESNVAGNLLTIWEFEGYLKYSPMFYGYYSGANSTEPHASGAYALGYVLPLAYFLTAVVVYIYSFVATLKKMAENSRNSKLSEKDDECTFSWKLFTGWDFMIGHAETAHNRIASVVLNFKEALLEEAEKKKDNRDWRIILQRVVVNILVIGLLGASGVSVVYLVSISEELNKRDDWLSKNAVNVCMNLLALIMPMIFEALGFFEHWHPRQQLRLQLARVMILNLLNLYSLMFTSFFKIESKGKPLHELQEKNQTATKELEELNLKWNQFMAMTTTTTEALTSDDMFTNLLGNDSTLSISSATESLMSGAATVATKFFCYNQTFPCSRIWKLPRNFSSPTTMATTTLMLLNLTTTLMPSDPQTMETTWTTPSEITGPTRPTTMPFDTKTIGSTQEIIPTAESFGAKLTTPSWMATTTPGSIVTQNPAAGAETTTQVVVSSTPMTTTTTEYPGNDTVFDYYDYFEGLSLNTEDMEKNPEDNKTLQGHDDMKVKRKRKNKRDKVKGIQGNLNEVYKTTVQPRKRKGKGKFNKVKLAKSNGQDATTTLPVLRKSIYSRRDKQADTTISPTNSIATSELAFETTANSMDETEPTVTEGLKTSDSQRDRRDDITQQTSLSSQTSPLPSATTTMMVAETNSSTMTTTMTVAETNSPTTKISGADFSQLNLESETDFIPPFGMQTSPLPSAQSDSDPGFTVTNSEQKTTTTTNSPPTLTTQSLSTFNFPSTVKNSPSPWSTSTLPTTYAHIDGYTTTTPTPDIIWEPNERLQDIVDFFTTSTPKPRNSPPPITTTTTTTEQTTPSFEDLFKTPFYVEGDIDTSQTVLYDFNEINFDEFAMCYQTICEELPTTTATEETTTLAADVTTTISPLQEYEKKRKEIEDIIDDIELQLTTMCWETALGQELSKVIVLDAIMAIGTSLIIDFLRALFVRYVNQNWCWDMEKTFPQYGDFKIAENILMLINNQGQVWMGIFFSPGLVLINLVKLVVMMYFRSWIVLTCNVPHEVVFKASKSNNFYLALLLTVLFLCVLPVGYAIVWLRPSWHCGPFSKYKTISDYIISTTMWALPEHLHKPLEYLTSSSTVIPLLLLMVLIIYYLISLTGALREANQDLKTQLQKEREEERKKFFKVPEVKASDNNSVNRWRKVLEASSPVTPTTTTTQQPDFESEEYKTQARKELISRIMKKALRKDSATSDEEPRHGRDDDTDTEHHDSLPHDEDGNDKRPGMSRLQQIRRTRKPSLVDIVQIANNERERLRSLHHHAQNGNGGKEIHPRGRFKVERPERKHEREEREKEKNQEKESTDNGNDPDIRTRVINERRQSLLRRKREEEEKLKEKEKEKAEQIEKNKETDITKEELKEKENNNVKKHEKEIGDGKDKDKEVEENKDTKLSKEKNGEKGKHKIIEIPKATNTEKGNGKVLEVQKDNVPRKSEDEVKPDEEKIRPSSPIRKRIYDSFRRKKRDDKEKLAAVKQNSLEKTSEEETKPEEKVHHEDEKKEAESDGKKKTFSFRKRDKHDDAEKSPPKSATKSSFQVVDEKSTAGTTTSHHDEKHSPLTLEHLHHLSGKLKFKRNRHKTPTEPEVFKFDTDKTGREADVASTPTWQHLEAEQHSPRTMDEVGTPTSAGHLHLGGEKLANFSRQSRRKIGSLITLVKDAVKRPEHELDGNGDSPLETAIDIPATPSIQMTSALNSAFMLPLALHTTSGADFNAATDSIQPYIMPRAPLEMPEDIDPPSYAHSITVCESVTQPAQDAEELDKAGPITFTQRGVSQRRRLVDRPSTIRQESQSSNWSVENIPTITISTTTEGDDQPKSPSTPGGTAPATSPPIPVPGSKVNIIKIHIDK